MGKMKSKSGRKAGILIAAATGFATWCLWRNKRYPLAKGYRPLNKFWCPGWVFTPQTTAFANRLMPPSGFDPSSAGVEKETFFVMAKDGHEIPVSVYRNRKKRSKQPCLLYFHGGGFALKAGPQYDRLMSFYAKGADCTVLFVHYMTSDRHPYPASFLDCLQVVKDVLKDSEKYGVDGQNLIVGGDSAGGCLAAAAALWCRDHQVPLKMQFLVYPVTDCRMNTKTDRKYWDAPLWNSPLSRSMWKIYLRNGTGKNPEYASPLLARDFTGLAPAWIETEQYDSLRDDATAYAKKLRQAKVPVDLHENPGAIHGFDVLYWTALSKRSIKRRIQALKKGFEERPA